MQCTREEYASEITKIKLMIKHKREISDKLRGEAMQYESEINALIHKLLQLEVKCGPLGHAYLGLTCQDHPRKCVFCGEPEVKEDK